MLTRRRFLHSAALTAAASRVPASLAQSTSTFTGAAPTPLLAEYPYAAVSLAPETLAEKQFRATQATLRGLDEDGLLKPYRLRTGLPTPGPDLGGWYDYAEPSEKSNDHGGGYGFCPGHTFGQWLSSFSRAYAIDRDPALRAKIVRLLDMYRPTINPAFYTNFRFPAYVYEKLNVGLLDSYRYAEIPEAKDLFARTREAALPHLPTRPLNRDEQRAWRLAQKERATGDFLYDESYTIPENLFHATHAGMGDYRAMARQYLLDKTWFDPLARNENVLDGKHAYSYCNSLNSGIQAYLDGGDPKYLKAAVNGFRIISEQSFATGGWGPAEGFDHPGGDRLYRSLSTMSASFETPCGAYANFKVTRGLMRITGQASYGDFMERTLYNTILGALPLQPDGRSFYYANFSNHGQKAYHEDAWPCCSGTIGQVTADYRISTYLHDDRGPFVNLYLPSTLRFTTPAGHQPPSPNSASQTRMAPPPTHSAPPSACGLRRPAPHLRPSPAHSRLLAYSHRQGQRPSRAVFSSQRMGDPQSPLALR